MAEIRTEEEQVQALKDWWKENGKSLLLGIAVALAGVFGWQTWQTQQATESANASILYQNLLDATAAALSPQSNEVLVSTAEHLATQLKDDYSSSTYAQYAALLMARLAADNDKLDDALTELEWVLNSQPSESLFALASLRKARILAAQDKLDAALAAINSVPQAGYDAAISELKGDIYVAKGDLEKARDQYESALVGASIHQPIIQMKLDDLAVEGS